MASQPGDDDRDGAGPEGSPLDALLTDAALGGVRRLVPVGPLGRLALGLGRHPLAVARRVGGLAATLAQVTAGRSDIAPARHDRRFVDQAWSTSWWFRRRMQTYLALGETVNGLIDDAGLLPAPETRVRFAAQNVVDALAPTNFAWSNPTVIKTTVDEGGRNFLRGVRNAVAELPAPPHLPAMVDRSAFTVGGNVAVTPGAVVYRSEVFELLQYQPRTEQVRSVPLVIVPPMINKFYAVDLAPGRSLVEYCVGQGQQVFVLSWRNPKPEHRAWGFDTYAGAIGEALEAASAITRSERAHLLALCSGGVVATALTGHLAAAGGSDRLAGLSLGVCMLDQSDAGTTGALATPRALRAARALSAARGYLDGRNLAGVFAWLRPNDLIWNYVVNNYLLGKQPPAFDVLFWNADTVRMTAGLHHDFLGLAADNSLVQPGRLELLGTPVDLGKIEVDAYVVAGMADHICPWPACYATTRLLGGNVRFVLSTSGHIAALVNPPGNPKASYQASDSPHPPEAASWQRDAPRRPGTWWEDWDAWLAPRSGPLRAAPRTLGNRAYPPAEAAPGTYITEP
ncbi:MAG TPA: poly(3-hydroxyalkanoate) polymerase [Acidimicrobiia bacterium]